MANALSDLKLPQANPDYMVSGTEEGDGTDYGLSLFTDGIHRQCLNADRIWDDPEPLAAIFAKEEADIDDEGENLDADPEELDGEEGDGYDTGRDGSGFPVVDKVVPGEDDTSQGGVMGLRRAACLGTGIWSVGGWVNRTRPDNSRGRRQRIKRARKAASASKAVLAIIAA